MSQGFQNYKMSVHDRVQRCLMSTNNKVSNRMINAEIMIRWNNLPDSTRSCWDNA